MRYIIDSGQRPHQGLRRPWARATAPGAEDRAAFSFFPLLGFQAKKFMDAVLRFGDWHEPLDLPKVFKPTFLCKTLEINNME